MKRISFLSLLLCCTVNIAVAKPRFIQFEKELAKAKFIGLVVIDRYDEKEKIFFHSAEYKDSLGIAIAHHNMTDAYACAYSDTDSWTGSWPLVKDTVLIVLDSTDRVSLFARKKNRHYRFWSPHVTGSIAMFSFAAPVLPLPAGRQLQNDKNSCWDGCLLPVEQLNAYRTHLYPYHGHAMMSGGEALFIWEFADSAAFYLDGVSVWDKQYQDKMITVTGELVQEKGKNVLKNWKIISVDQK